ncbi:uncharacterized protein tea [Calliphora vicina]|uniref:uncharacterized protein tea n=1 Tax=Calliphora vicina TaxID=7373 RepID=UPI00325AAEFA
MTSKKIPVSYGFFKKYTNHEECVSVMLKHKANGNKEAYEAMLKRKDCKEKALRSYYEAFYLKPKIREKYHISLKPVPKKIKDKLLVIPVQDTENISVTGSPGENNEEIDVIQEVINDIDNNSKNNNELEASYSNGAKKKELKSRALISAMIDDHEVEDDSEPLSSPDISCSSKQINAKINSPGQKNREHFASSSKNLTSPKINSKQSNVNISSIENNKSENSKASSTKPSNDKQTGLMANNNYKPAIPNTESKDESVHLNPDFNYKALVPYIHCCPLTIKEFRKNSNIKQLVAEFWENKHKSDFQLRIKVQQLYLLFYLAPEYRTIEPINKIQLAANSPEHIKNIFFNIPTNLYLKNDQENNNTNNKTEAQILPITNTPVTEPAVENKVIEQNKNEAPQDMDTNDVNQKAIMPEAVNNCNEQVNNVTQQNNIPLLTDHSAGAIANIPVTLDEFKKYSHHEEIVEKLFKIKVQDNKELYDKYKNSQEAFDSTLHNYYRAFYLSPTIRETFPIRFKPLPNSLKNRLLQIPEGIVKSTSLSSFRIEELVSFEFNLPVESNKGEEISAQQHTGLNSPGINSKQSKDNISSIENKESGNSKASTSKPSNDKQTGLMANNNYKPAIPNTESKNLPKATSATISVATNNKTEAQILPITNTSVTEPAVENKVIEQNKNEAPQDMDTNDVNQKAIMPEAVNNCNEHVNNETQQNNIPLLTDHSAGAIANIPVTLDEFKKVSHHEEIVNKLFKIKAQDDKELYYKYKNSQEAFDSTLHNYYRAFYLSPTIRETFPIRFKPLPNSLKNRLLQIPEGIVKSTSLSSFRIEELVSFEFNLPVVSNEDEEVSADAQQHTAVNNVNLSSTSPTKDNQSSGSESKTTSTTASGATKRSTTGDMKSTSPIGKKSKQAQDDTEKKGKTKILYKYLLPYVHCCPVRFSEFRKYTNVSELFSGHCQMLYKSLKKLPYMVHRAYVLYYLAPEYRNSTPLNKIKTLHECPIDLRSKIFEIPRNLYLKGENTDNIETQENIQTPTKKTDNIQTELNTEIQIEGAADLAAETTGAKKISSKSFVEILENRLLPPITLPLTGNCNAESQCPNTNCVFHHITQLEFVQLTNILHILPAPHDNSVIQYIYKKCIYQIVKEKTIDDKYVVKNALWRKLLKHNEMCEKCDSDIQPTLLKQVTSRDIIENERESTATVIESRDANNKSMQTNPTIAEEPMKAPALNKSSITNQAEISTINSQSQLETTDQQKNSVDLTENLKDDRIFQLFRQQLLAKLKQTFDRFYFYIDFTSDTYNIFLECNEIPLKQLLNDFCAHNDDVVQRILNEREIYEALQRYYYYKFLTNVEDNNNTTVETVMEMFGETQKDKTNTQISNSNEINLSKTNAGTTISAANNNNIINDKASEKAKRIFFRYVSKTDNLSYIIHTSFSLKQLILQAVLSMTFEEFLQLTSIYNGTQLYDDKHIAACMYRYVFRGPMVWPTNLFIKLKNLCDFLHAKNIRFDDYSNMLIHISPKLLHWSDLLTCTNILESIQIDYEKRTGKLLDTCDTPSLKHECIGYYNRCWKHEKWLRKVPDVYEEFYKDYLNSNNQGDVIIRDESYLQEICEEPNEVTNNIALDNNDMGNASIVQQDVSQPAAASNLNTSAAVDEDDVIMLEESDCQAICEEPNDVANNIALENKDMGNNSIVQQDVSQPSAASNLNTSAAVDEGDVIMLDISDCQAICEEPNDVANNIALENKDMGNNSIVQQDVSQPNTSNQNTSAAVDEDPDFATANNVEIPAELNTSHNRSITEFNCVMLPNTQQQIEMLPAEVRVSNDPLNKTDLVEIDKIDIKTEPINSKLLQNLKFYEDEDSIMQCTPCAEEIVELQESILEVGENLPLSQIEFEDIVIELILSEDNEMNIPQCLASSSGTACTQEQQTQPIALTSTMQLPDVSLRSSGEDETNEKIVEYQQQKQKFNEEESIKINAELELIQNQCESSLTSLQSFITYPEAQRFPSSFEDTQSYGGSLSAEQVTTSVQQDLISTTASENVNDVATETNTTSLVSKDVQPTTSISIQDLNTSNVTLRRVTVKIPKHKAKVRPLKNSDFVPQIQHNTRPLVRIPVNSTSSIRDNTELQPSTIISKGTHISISQELQTNCSVFNNTSLLRMVDHNYNQQSLINITPITLTQTHSQEAAGNTETNAAASNTNTNQQPTGRVTRRSNMLVNNNTQPEQTRTKSPLKMTTTSSNVTKPQASPRIVTRRTSLCKDTNDKNFFVHNRKI